MLVYMAPCGMGLGHAARCAAIAKELIKRGHEVVFSTYGEAVNYLKSQEFEVLRCYELSYEHTDNGGIDLEGTLAKGPRALYIFARQVGAELYYTGVLNPDVVVSDSRLSTSLAAVLRGIPNILIINQLLIVLPAAGNHSERFYAAKSNVEKLILEIMAEIWGKSDKIVIPDFPPPYTISKLNLVFEENTASKAVFIGPLIQKRPEETPSRKEIREKLGLKETPLVLVTPSGTKEEKKALAESLLNLLLDIDLEAKIIISMGDPQSRTYVKRFGDKITVVGWLTDKYLYLKAADVLVCHGGHTTIAEAMYYGVPMLVIPTTGHTERIGNAQSVVEMNLGKMLPQEELNAENLKELLKELLDNPEYMNNAREISRKVSVFNAAVKAADVIEELSEQF